MARIIINTLTSSGLLLLEASGEECSLWDVPRLYNLLQEMQRVPKIEEMLTNKRPSCQCVYWDVINSMEGHDTQEKRQSVVSCMHPDRGLNPQPRHVPWPGVRPVTFGFAGQCPTNGVTPGRALQIFLKNNCYSHITRGRLTFPNYFNLEK